MKNNELLLSLMKKYHMPCCLAEIGIEASPQVQEMYYEKLKSGSAIDENSAEELEKLRAGLQYLWGLK